MNKYFKIFQEKNRNIVGIEYSSDDQRKNYFNFIKEQHNRGLIQVIITSELMLKILEKYFIERKFKINKIKFAEEDSVLIKEIEIILENVSKDREYFFLLLKKLECIANNSSIDIEEIELLSTERKNGKYIKIAIRVNGIIILDEVNYDCELKEISKVIEENM